MTRLMELVGKLPIMQFAAICWSIAFLVTTFRYAFDHWMPSGEWLTSMEVTLGIVTGHYWVKRHTDHKHAAIRAAGGTNGNDPH